MSKPFSTLPLAPNLLKAIESMGYIHMTPIQEQAIPAVLEGRDVLGAAQTGTGKTAAFSVPLLQRLLKHAAYCAHRSHQADPVCVTAAIVNQPVPARRM